MTDEADAEACIPGLGLGLENTQSQSQDSYHSLETCRFKDMHRTGSPKGMALLLPGHIAIDNGQGKGKGS